MTARLPWQRAFTNESWVQLTACNTSWCDWITKEATAKICEPRMRNDREGQKHRPHKTGSWERREGGTSSLALVPHGGHRRRLPRGNRGRRAGKATPPPQNNPGNYGEGGRWEQRRSQRPPSPAGPAAGGSALGWGRGAGQGPRGSRGGRPRSTPATAPSSSLPSSFPIPAGMQRGAPGGSRVCSARTSPRSEAAPAAPRPARPPPPLTLRAVVEAVELPVGGQGLQRHRRRPRQRPPGRPWLRRTGLPAPSPRRTPGNGGGGGAWAPGEEAGQRWRRSAAPPCSPPSLLPSLAASIPPSLRPPLPGVGPAQRRRGWGRARGRPRGAGGAARGGPGNWARSFPSIRRPPAVLLRLWELPCFSPGALTPSPPLCQAGAHSVSAPQRPSASPFGAGGRKRCEELSQLWTGWSSGTAAKAPADHPAAICGRKGHEVVLIYVPRFLFVCFPRVLVGCDVRLKIEVLQIGREVAVQGH